MYYYVMIKNILLITDSLFYYSYISAIVLLLNIVFFTTFNMSLTRSYT